MKYDSIFLHLPAAPTALPTHSSPTPNFMSFSPCDDNPQSPISAAHMGMGMKPPTGTWKTYQWEILHKQMILLL